MLNYLQVKINKNFQIALNICSLIKYYKIIYYK